MNCQYLVHLPSTIEKCDAIQEKDNLANQKQRAFKKRTKYETKVDFD